jgi:hypothetical protein
LIRKDFYAISEKRMINIKKILKNYSMNFNKICKTFLKVFQSLLLFCGIPGIIFVQLWGFSHLIVEISKYNNFFDKMIGLFVLIGTPLVYYYLLKEFLENKKENSKSQ